MSRYNCNFSTLLSFVLVTLSLVPFAFALKPKFDKSLFLQGRGGPEHTSKIDYWAHYLANKDRKGSRGWKLFEHLFAHREIKNIVPNLKMFALAASSVKRPLGGASPKDIKNARDWLKERHYISIIKGDKKYRRCLVNYYYKFAPMRKLEGDRKEALVLLNESLELGKNEKSKLSQCHAFMKELIGAIEMYEIDNSPFLDNFQDMFDNGTLWSKMAKDGYVSSKIASFKGMFCPVCNEKYEFLPAKNRKRLSLKCPQHGEFESLSKKKKEQEESNLEDTKAKIKRLRKSNLYLRALDLYLMKTKLKECVHNAKEVHTVLDRYCSMEDIPPAKLYVDKSLDEIEGILHEKAGLGRSHHLRCPISNGQYAIIYDVPEYIKKRRKRRPSKRPVWHDVYLICPKHGYVADLILPW